MFGFDGPGTHSLRKGAISLVSSTLHGPNSASIHLRAGWSLGSVQDRYIFCDPGADQFCGRCLNALSLDDTTFAVLPPHFLPAQPLFVGDETAGWKSILPGYERLPPCFQSAARFMLASLVFHQDWLRASLPAAHPLFSSPVFTSGHAARLRPLILTGEFEHSESGLRATGIPPSVSQLRMISELSNHVQSLRHDLVDHTELLRNGLLEVPRGCVEEILKHIRVEGAKEVTSEDVSRMLADHIGPLSESVQQFRALLERGCALSATSPADVAAPAGPDMCPDLDDPCFLRFHWGGKLFRWVPQGFQFPR